MDADAATDGYACFKKPIRMPRLAAPVLSETVVPLHALLLAAGATCDTFRSCAVAHSRSLTLSGYSTLLAK